MKVSDIINALEDKAPIQLQESYDNSGLLVGGMDADIDSAMITLDVTEAVIEEALETNCSLIISHHPVIFSPLKRLTGSTYTERIILKAVKNDIALYAIHTNLDNIHDGVNSVIAEKLGIQNTRILKPIKGILRKLVTFCPSDYAEKVREAVFTAGAGVIGNYDSCSYNTEGFGSFKAGEGTNPFVGKVNEIHYENETRIETIYPVYLEREVLNALFSSHPYEEVAYDLYPLENEYPAAGAGMTGELPDAVEERSFLEKVKETFDLPVVRHTSFTGNKISKVSFCGGSGAFLIPSALRSGADIFLTADIKYHQFFDADERMMIADIGHYESEQFTKDLIFKILKDKFPNFALRISETDTNPLNYF
jgi:dinuclear metal center YbgI/SA1388 family protein